MNFDVVYPMLFLINLKRTDSMCILFIWNLVTYVLKVKIKRLLVCVDRRVYDTLLLGIFQCRCVRIPRNHFVKRLQFFKI